MKICFSKMKKICFIISEMVNIALMVNDVYNLNISYTLNCVTNLKTEHPPKMCIYRPIWHGLFF